MQSMNDEYTDHWHELLQVQLFFQFINGDGTQILLLVVNYYLSFTLNSLKAAECWVEYV